MENYINCIIVDDDLSAIRIIQDHIEEFPNINIISTFTDPIKALSKLSTDMDIDLVFLDIDMPKLTGLDLAKAIENTKASIIFTTAHIHYAPLTFDVDAKHFLLKPIDLDSFIKAVTKVMTKSLHESSVQQKNEIPIFIRPGERGKLTKITESEIIYIQGAGNYVNVFTTDDKHTLYLTIAEIAETLLKKNRFYRVHKSYLINCDYISEKIGNIIYLGKHPIPMSYPYKSDFMHFLEAHTWISKRV